MRAQIACGHNVAAARAALALLANCLAHGLQAEAAGAQLAVAAAYQGAEQPVLALPYALNALYHATALHLDLLAAAAVVAVAEIKLCMSIDLAAEARHLVEVRCRSWKGRASRLVVFAGRWMLRTHCTASYTEAPRNLSLKAPGRCLHTYVVHHAAKSALTACARCRRTFV